MTPDFTTPQVTNEVNNTYLAIGIGLDPPVADAVGFRLDADGFDIPVSSKVDWRVGLAGLSLVGPSLAKLRSIVPEDTRTSTAVFTTPNALPATVPDDESVVAADSVATDCAVASASRAFFLRSLASATCFA